MLSQVQAQEMSEDLKIDLFSVYREYLQLVIVNHLFSYQESADLIFKGGTALRLIYNSPRFSEDLDFNANFKINQIKSLIDSLIDQIKDQVPGVYLKYPDSLAGLTAKIYLPLKISPQDLTVKMDLSFREKTFCFQQDTVKTKFPVSTFSLIQIMEKKEILAEKVRAVLTRNKPRDLYDLWWLLNTGTEWDEQLIEQKLRMAELTFDKKHLKKQISAYSKKKLTQRLNKFLPVNNRQVVENLPSLLLKLLPA